MAYQISCTTTSQHCWLSTTIVPAINQFELHPIFQQAELAAACRSLNIAVEAYSPLGRGADLDAAAVRSLAETHGATPAQIVLAWHLSVGNIVIPKSASLPRVRENFGATGIWLTATELAAVGALECGARTGGDPATLAFTQMPDPFEGISLGTASPQSYRPTNE